MSGFAWPLTPVTDAGVARLAGMNAASIETIMIEAPMVKTPDTAVNIQSAGNSVGAKLIAGNYTKDLNR